MWMQVNLVSLATMFIHLAINTQLCAGCHAGATDPKTIRMSTIDYDGDANTTEGMYDEVATMEELLFARSKSTPLIKQAHPCFTQLEAIRTSSSIPMPTALQIRMNLPLPIHMQAGRLACSGLPTTTNGSRRIRVLLPTTASTSCRSCMTASRTLVVM